jgi:hypothetical protein
LLGHGTILGVVVAVTGVRAQELISEVLTQLEAVLPAGRQVAMTRHAKWLTLEHREPFTPEGGGGYYSTSIRGLGAWIPFLPARVSSRLSKACWTSRMPGARVGSRGRSTSLSWPRWTATA